MWTDSMIGNDSFLKSAIKCFVGATWHASGTAKMRRSNEPMAVVNQHCRVHGIENLRIVDASPMPEIPAWATNLTCIMLAERAAE
ncbi:MAG: GMC oxidoreductase [Burkholderiaceae bacterium]